MSLAKETLRPRLRTARLLFGIVAVSSSATAATHYALRDREGEAACGNIGQRGTTINFNAPIIEVTTAPADALVARPLVDDSGDPAPGNVMSKRPAPQEYR